MGSWGGVEERNVSYKRLKSSDPSKVHTLEGVVRSHVNFVLHQVCGGNVSEAARELDVHRRTLQRMLDRWERADKKAGKR